MELLPRDALGNNPAGLVSDFAKNANNGKYAHQKLSHQRGAVGIARRSLGTRGPNQLSQTQEHAGEKSHG